VAVQSVLVNTERGPVLLASDVTHSCANFLRHSPFVVTVDVAASLQSYHRYEPPVPHDLEDLMRAGGDES
jgi:hypothetical protein